MGVMKELDLQDEIYCLKFAIRTKNFVIAALCFVIFILLLTRYL